MLQVHKKSGRAGCESKQQERNQVCVARAATPVGLDGPTTLR